MVRGRGTHTISKSSFPVPTLQSAYAYTPKFELWMNGLVWQAIYNVINAYNTIEMNSENIPQAGIIRTATHAPVDIFIGRVRVLEDTVMAIQQPDNAYNNDLTRLGKSKDENYYHGLYKAILQLLHRNGHVRFKPPRDLADD